MTLDPALRCGAQGDDHGPVAGCCFRCGQLLCEQHLFHLPRSAAFDRSRPARPLVCAAHGGRHARTGLPKPGHRTSGRRRARRRRG